MRPSCHPSSPDCDNMAATIAASCSMDTEAQSTEPTLVSGMPNLIMSSLKSRQMYRLAHGK